MTEETLGLAPKKKEQDRKSNICSEGSEPPQTQFKTELII